MEIIVILFEYDRKNIGFLSVMLQMQSKEVERRRLVKRSKKEMLSVNMNPLAYMKKMGNMMANIVNTENN